MAMTPASTGGNTAPTMLWFGYVLLTLYCFCMLFSVLAWFGLAAFVLAFFVRRQMAAQGVPLGVAHATWQIHTVFISLGIFVVALGGVIGVSVGMGLDPVVAAQLDALKASNVAPLEGLKQLWDLPGMKALLAVILLGIVLFAVWPLKRALQGLLTLQAGVAPQQAGARGWLALLLALTVQGVIVFCL